MLPFGIPTTMVLACLASWHFWFMKRFMILSLGTSLLFVAVGLQQWDVSFVNFRCRYSMMSAIIDFKHCVVSMEHCLELEGWTPPYDKIARVFFVFVCRKNSTIYYSDFNVYLFVLLGMILCPNIWHTLGNNLIIPFLDILNIFVQLPHKSFNVPYNIFSQNNM